MSQYSKVLFIQKPDKNMHKAELANKPSLDALNLRLPAGKKWSIKVVDESEADEKLKDGPIDKSFITEAEAKLKVVDLQTANEAKDAEIEALKKQLAEKNGNNEGGADLKSVPPAPRKAADVIADIANAETAEAVDALVGDDKRVTVLQAATDKKAELDVA